MKVSFICASYNYAEFIAQTIESVLKQDFQDWELIVFDDGSTDNSLQVINRYVKKDSRIKLYTHENNSNKGLISTLISAASHAKGNWLAFIESDDLLKQDYLSQKFAALKDYPNCDMVFSAVEIMGNSLIRSNYDKIFARRDFQIKNNFNISLFLLENVVPTFSCVMIKKDIFNALDFSSPIAQNIDWWLWAQVFAKSDILYVNKTLSIWRKHEGSYISTVNASKFFAFRREIFNFIFKSDVKFLPSILLKLILYTNSTLFTKTFGSIARFLNRYALSLLYKLNKIKANLYYYSN